MCGMVAGWVIHVMWRLRAVDVWFVFLSCVRYWCTNTTDLRNVCVVFMSVFVCGVNVVCSCWVICRDEECYVVPWYLYGGVVIRCGVVIGSLVTYAFYSWLIIPC